MFGSEWVSCEHSVPRRLPLLELGWPPMVAESAFVELADRWREQVRQTPDESPLPGSADDVALACLLLAADWGAEFSEVASSRIRSNQQIAAKRGWRAWMDRLSWDLCEACRMSSPAESRSFMKLTANLDHHNSSIRIWMMEIGWCVREWLKSDEAIKRLLNNFGTTIYGPSMAAGLAACLFDSVEDFLEFAGSYAMPGGHHEDQYRASLKEISRASIVEAQAPLWQMECECRRLIERTSLGLRPIPLVP